MACISRLSMSRFSSHLTKDYVVGCNTTLVTRAQSTLTTVETSITSTRGQLFVQLSKAEVVSKTGAVPLLDSAAVEGLIDAVFDIEEYED